NGRGGEEIMRIAASLEALSEHPIARAIVENAGTIKLASVQNFESIPGSGVLGKIDGQLYKIGRPDLFSAPENGLPTHEIKSLQRTGKTTMLVGTDSEIIGVIGLMDEIRQEAIKTISRIKKAGKEVVMITGDNEETARAVAEQLNISHFYAGLLPEQKVDIVKTLTEKHGKVAMVGDGVNDAPALAAATVGIAMGAAGTDTALETADIALMSDDLTRLPYLMQLGRKAHGIIQQNIWASIVIKLSLALGVFPGFVSLVVAVLIGDMGASLGVTTNAMRLAKVKAQR
ncbi:MAG: heavy metal translocating P-type ATPase, partial [bacterium]